ncbi:MAG: hypothetical protein D6722_22540 [Bacteroidetes bacterium]|nr:MAG: hypothetical protein D6722_22540 [Bacteroidota bacterium]
MSDSHKQAAPQEQPPVQAGPTSKEDFGFGNKIGPQTKRLVNPDGSYNIRRVGGGFGSIHPYQLLIGLPWWQFMLVILGGYLLFNAFFALLYLWAGVEGLNGAPENLESAWDRFKLAFFFSAQTFTTVGYGSLSPNSLSINMIATFEAMTGLMGFALATGLLYGRFSQPSAKIGFSDQALIAPYQEDLNGFMFRIVNRRKNILLDLEVQVAVMWYVPQGEGFKQEYHFLKLERRSVTVFPLTWTIVHPIESDSPLLGLSAELLEARRAEFLIMLKGFDDTFGQHVHARRSYKFHEVVWGAKFTPAFHPDEEGHMVLELDRVSDWEKAALR